ncbi:ankyrin repeat domain-containing protein [Bordetella sp. 15P40C-2]|uniref:ankyrin repeat domain-containing protein n=1 Tax=Bordetella sp. 15P40C-2 TaxID=2572246 RepID=UPI00132C7E6C|nr:ankyrin repeat domain-containing protein [Bordetella sp. 15P40C-2]MVW71845.1 hypothetical protein [Bordetella sp. 15P40C-2]
MFPFSNLGPIPHQITDQDLSIPSLGGKTPNECLDLAIISSNVRDVRDILEHMRVDYRALNADGLNPIHRAIYGSSDAVIQLLIDKASKLDPAALHDPDKDGYTPLMHAVLQGEVKLALELIRAHGATEEHGREPPISYDSPSLFRETRDNAIRLIASGGDTATAQMVALAQRDEVFLKMFSGWYADLQGACASGRLEDARDALANGADPSYLLAKTMSFRDGPVILEKRATVIKNLMALGADLNAALAFGDLSGLGVHGMSALVLLGASPEKAMNILEQRGIPYEPKDFDIGFDPAHRIRKLAMEGDHEGAVDVAGAVPPNDKDFLDCRVLIPLANEGHLDAISGLLAEDVVELRPVVDRLVRSGNLVALQNIVAAAQSDTLFVKVFGPLNSGKRVDVNNLSELFAAGFDPSKYLWNLASQPQNRFLARILIAAGARIENALRSVPADRRSEASQVLNALSHDVAGVIRQVQRTYNPGGITLVEDILIAQGIRDRGLAAPINSVAEQLRAMNKIAESNLLEAVLRVDWPAIYEQVGRSQETAGNVLMLMVLRTPLTLSAPYTRLLVQAGTDLMNVADSILDQYRLNEWEAIRNVGALVHAGYNPIELCELLVDMDLAQFAQRMVQGTSIDLLDAFASLAKMGDVDRLRKLVPLQNTFHPHDLIIADPKGGAETARKLIAAGMDATGALSQALLHDEGKMAAEMCDLGVDEAAALAPCLIQNAFSTLLAFVVRGTDIERALAHIENPVIQEALRQGLKRQRAHEEEWGAQRELSPTFRMIIDEE